MTKRRRKGWICTLLIMIMLTSVIPWNVSISLGETLHISGSELAKEENVSERTSSCDSYSDSDVKESSSAEMKDSNHEAEESSVEDTKSSNHEAVASDSGDMKSSNHEAVASDSGDMKSSNHEAVASDSGDMKSSNHEAVASGSDDMNVSNHATQENGAADATATESEFPADLEELEALMDDPDYEHITSITPEITLNEVAVFLAAASEKGILTKSSCVTFSRYDSPTWRCHRYLTTGAHNYYHSYYTTRISYHQVDGSYAYCIEPSAASASDIEYTGYQDSSAKSSSFWMLELDEKQRTYIKRILACSYPNKTYGYGKQATYAAGQTLIWEVVSKSRYKNLESTTDSGLYDKIYKVLGDSYKNAYQRILKEALALVSSEKRPSFAGSTSAKAKEIQLVFNEDTNCYEAKVEDKNQVLSHYVFQKNGVEFTRKGNVLKISVALGDAAGLKGKVASGTSDQLSLDTCDPYVWENSSYQTVVSAGSASPKKAYIKLNFVDVGKVCLEKYAWNTVENVKRPEKGAVFQLWKTSSENFEACPENERQELVLDEDGYVCSKFLPVGHYYLKQVSGWNGYELIEDTIELEITELLQLVKTDIEGNKLIFKDKIWTGTLEICKIDGNTEQPLEGAVFELRGSDGTVVPGITDAEGKVTFTDLYYGVNYEWKEVIPPEGYELGTGCSGTWAVEEADAFLSITCQNFKERYGAFVVKKTDHSGKPLAGCVFLLEYQDGTIWKPVRYAKEEGAKGICTSSGLKEGCLTTGKDGVVRFTGLYIGDMQYRLSEVKAPEGHSLLADPVIYEGDLPMVKKVSELPEGYQVEAPNQLLEDEVYFYELSFTIQDGSLFCLPVTGGDGMLPWISGISIVILALGIGTLMFQCRKLEE